MARYDAGHKDATRRRILEAAGRRLKTTGIDGSGIALLMKDAGLTNGAFYAHFASKDDLVAAVVADQLTVQAEVLAAAVAATGGLGPVVEEYLGRHHRADIARGCPSAALLDEVARGSDAVRQAYSTGIDALVDALLDALPADGRPADAGDARAWLTALLGQLAGTLQVARALTDDDGAEAVLAAGRRAVQQSIMPSSQLR